MGNNQRDMKKAIAVSFVVMVMNHQVNLSTAVQSFVGRWPVFQFQMVVKLIQYKLFIPGKYSIYLYKSIRKYVC
jgi:hypothetical protein